MGPQHNWYCILITISVLHCLGSCAVVRTSIPSCGSEYSINASPNDCTSYVVCSNSIRYLFSCAKGTLFNDDIKRCDWATNVDCNRVPDTGACSCPEERGRFPKSGDCTKWCHCDHGTGHVKDCPACHVGPDCPEGKLYFDPHSGNCAWPRDVPHCGENPTPSPVKCLDDYVECKYWAQIGLCTTHDEDFPNAEDFFIKHCPLSCRAEECGFTPDPTTPTTTPVPTTTAHITTQDSEICRDKYPDCQYLADMGYCTPDTAWGRGVIEVCPTSCKVEGCVKTTTTAAPTATAAPATTPSDITTAATTTTPADVTTGVPTTTPIANATTAVPTTKPADITTAVPTTTHPYNITTAVPTSTPADITTAVPTTTPHHHTTPEAPTTTPPANITTSVPHTTPADITTAATATTPADTTTAAPSTTEDPYKCIDKFPICDYLAGRGYCLDDKHVIKTCPQSCKVEECGFAPVPTTQKPTTTAAATTTPADITTAAPTTNAEAGVTTAAPTTTTPADVTTAATSAEADVTTAVPATTAEADITTAAHITTPAADITTSAHTAATPDNLAV